MGHVHSVYVPTSSCNLCQELGLSRSTWFEVDLRFVHEPPSTQAELVLVARPPAARAGADRLRWCGTTRPDRDAHRLPRTVHSLPHAATGRPSSRRPMREAPIVYGT